MNRSEFQSLCKSSLILAPLTKGGNLPFRRLCVEYGADITVSEMAFARRLVKGEGRERALLRRHTTESTFGVQLAALQVEEATNAAKMAIDAGASFIDINCGCPIDDIVRRGLGAALLRRPKALYRLVEHLAKTIEVPVTVKIRTGWNESSINVLEIVKGLEAAGAAVITIHGRTREQRYSRSADWALIGEAARSISIPVVGNGDLLTPYEWASRREKSGVGGAMIGRGALIKPWLFAELKSGECRNISALERVGVYWKLAQYMKEHFGDDEIGLRRILGFLPWHFSFFHRYRYLPESEFASEAESHPLIQSRVEKRVFDTPLDEILAQSDERVHQILAQVMLTSESPETAGEEINVRADELMSLAREQDEVRRDRGRPEVVQG